ncbi:MAG: glycosyltransferase [Elusimicrobia bacterium]|nr:glycosyltransferase [Elusimicrobiota bacterium]
MIRLSICIPTYNFGKFVGQTLDSILPNLMEGVEVVVLDGGSTDDTAHVVAQRQLNFPQIKYHRQEFRGGIDRDIAKVVSLAHGDYCWLFSADDIMMPGAVDKVLNSIRSNCDIYLCQHILCSFEMQPIKEYPIFAHITAAEIFDLGNVLQRERYFSHAVTSEAFFSFLSGPIFKRGVWQRTEGIPESFYETCWGLAGRLLSLAPGGLVVQYLGKMLIYKRGENDSFGQQGLVNRLRISVEGFAHIAETIFGKDSQEVFHIRRVVRNEWPLRSLMRIKLIAATSPQQENMETLKKVAAKHYLNAGVGNMCRYVLFRLMPVSFIKLGGLLKKLLIKRRSLPQTDSPVKG